MSVTNPNPCEGICKDLHVHCAALGSCAAPRTLRLLCVSINNKAFLMKTIQVNQAYQKAKASVIWENC